MTLVGFETVFDSETSLQEHRELQRCLCPGHCRFLRCHQLDGAKGSSPICLRKGCSKRRVWVLLSFPSTKWSQIWKQSVLGEKRGGAGVGKE